MSKSEFYKKIPMILTIALSLAMVVLVFFLMTYVQSLLDSDVRINLQEVAIQNRDVITSKLNLEMNNVNQASNQISAKLKEKGNYGESSFHDVIKEYGAAYEDTETFISNLDGRGFFYDEKVTDVTGRQYFRLASQGIQNISEKIVSRYDGEDIFIISVPLYYEGRIIGTVQRSYTVGEMYEMCSVSLFSDQGNMHIVNSDGYIVVGSQAKAYNMEADNYFKTIYIQGNHEQSRQISSDVKENRGGFMETVVDGQKTFSAYTPLEGIHDWYLVSSISHSAVSPNANTVIKMFYFILMMVVFAFGLIFFYFLTTKNKQQQKIEEIAFIDTVTEGGTFNKFIIDVGRAINENPDKQYYILFFDIDNFKYFNSYFGFDFGDMILRTIFMEVVSRLSGDESAARISGDHFAVFLEDASSERLKDLTNFDVLNIDQNVSVYISAGIYMVSDKEESVSLMVDKARMAARSGKGLLKKDVIPYTDKFDKTMLHNERLKRQVVKAIEDGEFIPFFQAKTDIRTRELVGAEALARWKTSDGRMVSPGDFIPVCEQIGVIVDLDMTIFDQVLTFLEKKIAEGVKCVPISVNFSRVHLGIEHFLERIVEKMDSHNVPHDLIEVELTESVIFDNYDTISKFADDLQENNIKLDIDDFGSGYSSLNMLKDISVDIIKIDKGFLDDTRNFKRQRIIIHTIAEMAKKLDIGVVVEGVETEENLELMRECGCFVAQGYYFARPKSEEEFDVIFREGKV